MHVVLDDNIAQYLIIAAWNFPRDNIVHCTRLQKDNIEDSLRKKMQWARRSHDFETQSHRHELGLLQILLGLQYTSSSLEVLSRKTRGRYLYDLYLSALEAMNLWFPSTADYMSLSKTLGISGDVGDWDNFLHVLTHIPITTDIWRCLIEKNPSSYIIRLASNVSRVPQ